MLAAQTTGGRKSPLNGFSGLFLFVQIQKYFTPIKESRTEAGLMAPDENNRHRDN
ncbi:hypothetical protein Geob_3880 [Geotalea daltonii FRC-32]|uniref:Uncharacterized protein n=1 Tax=Geotalea daltonii (strain DSM 22248 / JCM 15807 / FRC-32) TaxID=316067 RepID=A0A068EZZ8_GEODF|nr:hypothetical protein Geob_3880 [Geotalea daltonii FRC-32]